MSPAKFFPSLPVPANQIERLQYAVVAISMKRQMRPSGTLCFVLGFVFTVMAVIFHFDLLSGSTRRHHEFPIFDWAFIAFGLAMLTLGALMLRSRGPNALLMQTILILWCGLSTIGLSLYMHMPLFQFMNGAVGAALIAIVIGYVTLGSFRRYLVLRHAVKYTDADTLSVVGDAALPLWNNNDTEADDQIAFTVLHPQMHYRVRLMEGFVMLYGTSGKELLILAPQGFHLERTDETNSRGMIVELSTVDKNSGSETNLRCEIQPEHFQRYQNWKARYGSGAPQTAKSPE